MVGRGADRAHVEQSELLREHRGGARLDDVGVGVGGDESAVGADEFREQRALVAVFGDRGDAAQEQRVVHEQQVGPRGDGFVDAVGHRVDGEVNG